MNQETLNLLNGHDDIVEIQTCIDKIKKIIPEDVGNFDVTDLGCINAYVKWIEILLNNLKEKNERNS